MILLFRILLNCQGEDLTDNCSSKNFVEKIFLEIKNKNIFNKKSLIHVIKILLVIPFFKNKALVVFPISSPYGRL